MKEDKTFVQKILSQDPIPEETIDFQQEKFTKYQKVLSWSTKILWGVAAFFCVFVGWGFLYVCTKFPNAAFGYSIAGILCLAVGFACSFQTATTRYGLRYPSLFIILLLAYISIYFIYTVSDIVADKNGWLLQIVLASLLITLYVVIPLLFWSAKNFVMHLLQEIKELRIEIACLREENSFGQKQQIGDG